MSPLISIILVSVILALVSLIGAITFLFSEKKLKNILLPMIAFSAGGLLGGAFFHNIGMPPKGHQFYDPNARQRPLKFDDCDLNGSIITNCNLSDVSIDHCNLKGMKINGILVEALLQNYQK